MRSTIRNSPPPPTEILSVVKHYAPSDRCYYRLRDLHSQTLVPGEGKTALVCDPSLRIDSPSDHLSVGTYQILYYRGAFDLGSLIAPPEGQQSPTVVVSDDGVLMTPADWWRSEEAKHYHLERRDLTIRREAALTRTIEAQNATFERMTANLIEREAAITENQVAINKLQVDVVSLIRDLIAHSKSATDAQGDALVNASRKIAEAVNHIKTDNMATVGVELVKQVGAIAQTFAANSGNRETALKEGRPRILEHEPGPPAKLPPAAQTPKAKTPEDPPPPPAPPPAASPPTAPAAQRRGLPADLCIPWDDLFSSMDAAPPSEPPVALVPDCDPIEGTTDGSSAHSADEPTHEAALGPLAPGAMPDFSRLLEFFGLRAPVVRPSPSEWSPAWAVRKIKERLASLSEVSIAWLLSSWQNALSYVRELADLARPPEPARLAEEGSR